MKEVHDLMEFRVTTWEAAYCSKQGHMLRFDDFLAIKRKSQALLHSLAYARTKLRLGVCGEEFWVTREMELRTTEGHRLQDNKRRNSQALVSTAMHGDCCCGLSPLLVFVCTTLQKYFVETKISLPIAALPYKLVALSEKEFEEATRPKRRASAVRPRTTETHVTLGASLRPKPARRLSNGSAPLDASITRHMKALAASMYVRSAVQGA